MSLLNILIFVTAALSSLYWYRSAKVRYPSELGARVFYGGMASVGTDPLVNAARETGRLNKIAAAFAAAAALFTAMGSITAALTK